MTVPTTYMSSDGRETPIREMNGRHLLNSLRKRERDTGGGADPLTEALRAEVARREVEGEPMQIQPAPTPQRSMTDIASNGGAPVGARLQPAGLGDNKPPEENPLVTRLNERHDSLLTEIATVEIDASMLPLKVETEEQAAQITAWVARSKVVLRRLEDARSTEKEDFLRAGQAVDKWARDIRDVQETRREMIERRTLAYLLAKQEREKKEAESRAAAAAQAAQQQRDLEEAERREAAAAAQRRADAEDALAKAAAAASDPLVPAETSPEVRQAEETLRAAIEDEQLATGAADQANKDARALDKVADRAERVAAGDSKLERVTAGGASTTLLKSYRAIIENRDLVKASMGPLAPYFTEPPVLEALARAAKAEVRPQIPGVRYEEDVKPQTR